MVDFDQFSIEGGAVLLAGDGVCLLGDISFKGKNMQERISKGKQFVSCYSTFSADVKLITQCVPIIRIALTGSTAVLL